MFTRKATTITTSPSGVKSFPLFHRQEKTCRPAGSLGGPTKILLVILGIVFLTASNSAFAQTPTPGPVSQKSITTPAKDLNLSPQEEIQVLDGIDYIGNTPTPGATSAPVTSFGPPPVPTGIKILTLKDGVYLSWDSAPVPSHVVSYNVYRSTVPGIGYKLVNLKPLPAPYFLDGAQNSLSAPKNGEDYFYVVAAVDSQGTVGAYSEENTVTPQGLEIPLTEEEKAEALKPKATLPPEEEKVLDVPQQKIINLQLPADTQLSIQGYKKIEAVFSFQHFNRDPKITAISADNNNTQVNQELVVNLQGKVGKNVDVNVDYSDVNRNNGTGTGGVDQTKQNISIVYHGNEDSPIQEVAFGDLDLYLPNTEFAGFSKKLFGLQAKLKFDRFRFSSFFAQTKGISETKVFKGNYVQVKRDIQDIEYMRFRYFLITRASSPVTIGSQVVNNALPQSNSEEIWVDPANGIFPDQSNPKIFRGFFEHWLPGKDYTIDYSTGVITFNRALSLNSRIAVAFIDRNNNSIGYDPSGQIDLTNPDTLQVDPNGLVTNVGRAYLIKDNKNSTVVSPLYLLNYFDLGRDKIVPPQQDPEFLFQIIDQGNNNTLQTGGAGPWAFQVNQDLNLLTVTNTSVTFAAPPYFPERPFANIDASAGTGPGDVYSQTSPPASAKRIHVEYKTKLDFYRLDRFNIIRGSEAVYLDGHRLKRDADYFFDYNSGFLDFQDKSLLRPDSQVVVTYEYAPFGSFGQNNILGARAEYDLTDHFFLGSTFLYTTTQQPNEVPQIGSTPNSLAVVDADAKYDISPEDLQSITGIIPGLENWKPPLNIKLSGEVAQSYFSPNTFDAEGESGVAMIDNMEGIDNSTSPAMNPTNWLVSSPPLAVPSFLPGLSPNGSQTLTNNRVRFYNDSAPATQMDFQQIGTQNGTGGLDYTSVPGYGGHTWASSQNGKDVVSVLQFPYSHLSSQNWAGVRQVLTATGTDLSNTRYFQTWICNDGIDKWVMFDFGIINEDSNSNAPILDHDPNQGSPSLSNPGYGIPTFYALGTPWNNSSPGSGAQFDPATGGFLGYQGEVSQEGVSNNLSSNTTYITEDMNGNGVLDTANSYFEYGVRVNWPYKTWKQVKIPINFTAPDALSFTSDGISYFFHQVGAPNPQIVKAVRVWTTGTTPAEVAGGFWIENIGFSRNLWQLEVDPDANANQSVTVNTGKFDVSSISHEQEPDRYQGILRFLTIATGQDQTAILNREKSLKITYNLSSADFEPANNINGKPIYYATRLYGQGLDFTDFQELRLDLQIKSYQPGEILFIRLGNDQKNFYQYNIQLVDKYLSTWNTLVIPLDGSKGNRLKVGKPFLNRSSQISFGVVSPNAPSAQSGELWINNLRTVSPAGRTGLARRVNAAFNLGDNFATVNTRYREVDSGFTQMDQTSTHFQHSRQLGADYSSNAVKLFGQPLSTDFHVTQQDTTTEEALKQNPYYLALPDTRVDNATGSIGYTKDLGPSFGRLTNVRVSGSTNYETDKYLDDYKTQPGVQGDTRKGQEVLNLNSTYDAPLKLFFLNIGTNQFNQTFTLTHDRQEFLSAPSPPALALANYDRTTRLQNYSWTNTTELVKNLVFTPGYSLSLIDAMGNTNSPGVQGTPVPDFVPFQQGYKPKIGMVFRGIPGITPQADYSGSNQYDFVSFPDGTRFTNANSQNLSVNLSPGIWFPLLQQIGVTIYGGWTENLTETIPNFGSVPVTEALTFEDKYTTWSKISKFALTGNKSDSEQVNGSFRLFDVWEFKPTGAWNQQESVLSRGANPIKQDGRTLGLTTNYTKRIFTVPFIKFNLNSAQFQYTRTENNQYDSSNPPIIDTQSYTDLYSFTFPYDINAKAQGNIHLQRTTGHTLTRQTETLPHDDLGYIEYTQKFAPNLEIHIPFTKWKLKLQDAIELRSTFSMEFIENDSNSVYTQIKTQKYRGTIDLTYNALKNLKVGIGLANEYFTNTTYELSPTYDPTDETKKNHTFDYTLWQGTISVEARF